MEEWIAAIRSATSEVSATLRLIESCFWVHANLVFLSIVDPAALYLTHVRISLHAARRWSDMVILCTRVVRQPFASRSADNCHQSRERWITVSARRSCEIYPQMSDSASGCRQVAGCRWTTPKNKWKFTVFCDLSCSFSTTYARASWMHVPCRGNEQRLLWQWWIVDAVCVARTKFVNCYWLATRARAQWSPCVRIGVFELRM